MIGSTTEQRNGVRCRPIARRLKLLLMLLTLQLLAAPL